MTEITELKMQEFTEKVSNISSMERGKLSEFYRIQPGKNEKEKLKFGPYYKLQTWQNGKNITRHIPAADVPALKEALANHDEFSKLVESLEKTIISETHKQRSKTTKPKEESKKNSAKK